VQSDLGKEVLREKSERIKLDDPNRPHDKNCFSKRKNKQMLKISGFRHNVHEICTLLGHYVVSCGNCFLLGLLTLEDGTDTLVNNYHTTLCNNPEEHRFHQMLKRPKIRHLYNVRSRSKEMFEKWWSRQSTELNDST
jgi:hypothetical protein